MTEQHDHHVLTYRMHCEIEVMWKYLKEMRKYLIWRSSQSWAQ
jgi:hypothetical protein